MLSDHSLHEKKVSVCGFVNSPHLLLQVVSLFIRVHWSLPKGCCITCNVSIEGQISKGMGKRVHCWSCGSIWLVLPKGLMACDVSEEMVSFVDRDLLIYVYNLFPRL